MEDIIAQLLKANRHQRHDFLNHLQVIWGFIKLNKGDQAIDYIQRVTQYIQGLRELNNIECDQLAAEISAQALEIGFKSNFHVSIPEKWVVPGEKIPTYRGILASLFTSLVEDINWENIKVKLTIINGEILLEVQTLLEGHRVNWQELKQRLDDLGVGYVEEDEVVYYRLLVRH